VNNETSYWTDYFQRHKKVKLWGGSVSAIRMDGEEGARSHHNSQMKDCRLQCGSNGRKCEAELMQLIYNLSKKTHKIIIIS
jgi:hypothetical protein